MIIISVILTLIIIFIIYRCLRTFFCWVGSWLDVEHIIEFEEFKSLYEVNPKHWELRPDSVRYESNPGDYWNSKNYLLRFSFVDYLKYRSWKFDLSNKEEKSKLSKEYQEFREAIAQDLEKIKE